MVSVPHRRVLIAILAVTAIVGLAGCSALSDDISDEELDRDGEYADLRERNATVAIDLKPGGFFSEGEFRSVYTVNGTDELELYRTGLYQDHALDIHSVEFRYPNGTAVTGSELDVARDQSRTTVDLPAENGSLAFSGSAGRKSFSVPNYLSGSYNVTLPADHRSSSFLLGSVSPGDYDRTIRGDTETLYWESADNSISINYYLERDVWLFYGVVAVVVVAGGAAAALTYRRVRNLRRRREAIEGGGDDDFDGGR